jgi:hypothetical protein
VILGNAGFSGLSAVKLDETIADFEFDVDDLSNLAKTSLQILWASVLGETTDVDLVRLHSIRR